MHGIGEHRDAACPPTTNDLHQGESEVDEEGGAEGYRAGGGGVAVGVIGMMMGMPGVRVRVRAMIVVGHLRRQSYSAIIGTCPHAGVSS